MYLQICNSRNGKRTYRGSLILTLIQQMRLVSELRVYVRSEVCLLDDQVFAFVPSSPAIICTYMNYYDGYYDRIRPYVFNTCNAAGLHHHVIARITGDYIKRKHR